MYSFAWAFQGARNAQICIPRYRGIPLYLGIHIWAFLEIWVYISGYTYLGEAAAHSATNLPKESETCKHCEGTCERVVQTSESEKSIAMPCHAFTNITQGAAWRLLLDNVKLDFVVFREFMYNHTALVVLNPGGFHVCATVGFLYGKRPCVRPEPESRLDPAPGIPPPPTFLCHQDRFG